MEYTDFHFTGNATFEARPCGHCKETLENKYSVVIHLIHHPTAQFPFSYPEIVALYYCCTDKLCITALTNEIKNGVRIINPPREFKISVYWETKTTRNKSDDIIF